MYVVGQDISLLN